MLGIPWDFLQFHRKNTDLKSAKEVPINLFSWTEGTFSDFVTVIYIGKLRLGFSYILNRWVIAWSATCPQQIKLTNVLETLEENKQKQIKAKIRIYAL